MSEIDELMKISDAWSAIYYALCDASHLSDHKSDIYARATMAEALEEVARD